MKFDLANDFLLDIATGKSRMTAIWHNRQVQWSRLLEKCAETRRTQESAAEYARMSRERKSEVKDVGGFVGGYLSGGKRKTGSVLYRTMATLDLDYGVPEAWELFRSAFHCAAMLYSTHSHTPDAPRYRLVIPFNRQVAPVEYEPVARKIAERVGIEQFDDSTYDLPRLFYWPSSPKDGEFVFEYQDGPACDVDAILKQYVDPMDASAWPVSSREGERIRRELQKAGDPTTKPGNIGDFCRAYTIEAAIEDILGDYYTPTGIPGRYTYKLGSVAGGLVCYEGKFAYSHHDTDPASRKLCNAFDLCRIHLFGDQDTGSRTEDVTKLPSYRAMEQFVADDPTVKQLRVWELRKSADEDFGDVCTEEEAGTWSDAWTMDLKYTGKSGKLVCSIQNIALVLENDPAIRGKLRHNDFSGKDEVLGGVPWESEPGQWTDRDEANLRAWLERVYGLTGKDKISDALATVFTRHRYHPVRDYLNELAWDGVPRLERLIIDYIGAEDTPLNRAMTRAQFTAAVARVFEPGCKYDYCLILAGAEGVGKSTLLARMGGAWFSDCITSMDGKEGMEQLSNVWIAELGELSGIKRSDVESVKSYLSRQVDKFRPAYHRHEVVRPRQCVFFGTTNEDHFLRGDTGNRRFWIIPVDPALRKHGDWMDAIARDRDQLWAEAVANYRRGGRLILPAELEAEARARQEKFNEMEDDPLWGSLNRFLDMKLPADWSAYSLERRRDYIRDGEDPTKAAATETRTRVCALEFLCEVMRMNPADKNLNWQAKRISSMLDRIPGWERVSLSRHAESLYGRQRAYVRKLSTDEDEL